MKGILYQMIGYIRSLGVVDLLIFSILLGKIGVINLGGKTPTLFWADLYLISLIFLFILYFLFVKSSAKKLGYSGIDILYLVYIGFCIVSMVFSQDILRTLEVLKRHVLPIFVFWLVYYNIKTEKDIQRMLTTILIFGTLMSLVILLNWKRYSLGALSLGPLTDVKEMSQLDWGRNNYLASIIIIIIPLAFSRLNTLAAVSGILMMITLIFTLSRGAIGSLFFGAFFGLSIFILFKRGYIGNRIKIRPYMLFIIVIAVFMLLVIFIKYIVPDAVTELLFDRYVRLAKEMILQPETVVRFQKYSCAWNVFQSHPVLGVGLGNQGYFLPGFGRGNIHNIFLEVLVETGIAGFIFFAGFLTRYLYTILKMQFKGEKLKEILLNNAFMISFLSACINAFVEPSFWGVQYSYLFFTIMGVVYSKTRLERSDDFLDTYTQVKS